MYVNFTLDNLRNCKILITCGNLTQPSRDVYFQDGPFSCQTGPDQGPFFPFSFFGTLRAHSDSFCCLKLAHHASKAQTKHKGKGRAIHTDFFGGVPVPPIGVGPKGGGQGSNGGGLARDSRQDQKGPKKLV